MIPKVHVSEQEAVANCASALRQSKALTEFKRCADALEQDSGAQEGLRALQEKRDSIRALMLLNALSEADRDELQRLERAVYTNPVIDAYLHAEEQAAELCREVNDRISAAIGMRFALKRSSCCG